MIEELIQPVIVDDEDYFENLEAPQNNSKEPTEDPREREKRDFYTKIEPLLIQAKTVFELLDQVGLKYALIRHLGVILPMYDRNFHSLLKGYAQIQQVNDIDILINFDSEKITKFVANLESLPGIQEPIIFELKDQDNRSENEFDFSSDAFIRFTLNGCTFDIFANFGTRGNQDNPRQIFASIDENGQPDSTTQNHIAQIDYQSPGIDQMNIPCVVGEGIVKSYEIQYEQYFQNPDDERKFLSGAYNAELRLTLAAILDELLNKKPQ
jgi:hypothetical protein